ncbi:MAG: response regulator transcription factor [Ruminococcus sp.]|nr:response regulator transcription factor [Ruminococcus sp.]
MSKIIIIEDDIYLREELVTTFAKKEYSVSGISSFVTPEQEILDSEPDLAVLDINLPGKSGFELCKWLKARSDFPILILTARDTLSDELLALGLGADDFLTKPCHPERLLARVERLLQTYGKMRNIIQVGELTLDTDTYKVIWRNSHVILPETEGKILQILMEQHPSLVDKQDLFSSLWGGSEYVDENILQVNINRLRKSLDTLGLRDIIQTIRGQGYRLEVFRT